LILEGLTARLKSCPSQNRPGTEFFSSLFSRWLSGVSPSGLKADRRFADFGIAEAMR
jgi:hypothetical protein